MSNLLQPLLDAMQSACEKAQVANIANIELVTEQLYTVPVTEIVNPSLPCVWWYKVFDSVRGGYALYIYFDQVDELHTLASIQVPKSAKGHLKALQKALYNELNKVSISAMLGMAFPALKTAVNQ